MWLAYGSLSYGRGPSDISLECTPKVEMEICPIGISNGKWIATFRSRLQYRHGWVGAEIIVIPKDDFWMMHSTLEISKAYGQASLSCIRRFEMLGFEFTSGQLRGGSKGMGQGLRGSSFMAKRAGQELTPVRQGAANMQHESVR